MALNLLNKAEGDRKSVIEIVGTVGAADEHNASTFKNCTGGTGK
jgi:hypothetical protein